MMYEFTVPGDPVPWTAWPKRGAPPEGFLRCQAWQAQIAAYAKHYWNGADGPTKPIEGPVRLEMDFYLPWPKSAPQKNPRMREEWQKRNYPRRKDLRNMGKACEDALQGIVYVNDSQVITAGPDHKSYTLSAEGFTIIRVEKLT